MMESFFAYRLPYGPALHKDWATLEFMRDAGVEVICFTPANSASGIGMPYADYPLIWRGAREYDFDSLERQIQDILAHHHRARLLPVIDLNTPPWLSHQLGCDSFISFTEALSNPEWKLLALEFMRTFVGYCHEHHAERMFGYIPSAGRTFEWHEAAIQKPGFWKSIRYPEYCRERNWPELPIPSCLRTGTAVHDFVRDPELEADVIQFQRYSNALVADFAIEAVSELRKIVSENEKIGLFYGYMQRLVSHGHSDSERAFDTAPPDFVVGASCGADHTLGCSGGYAMINKTMERHDIRVLHEIDRLTVSTSLPNIQRKTWKRWTNTEETIAGLRREVGMALINHFSAWYFNIWGQSYADPDVRLDIAKTCRIWQKFSTRSSGSRAELLLVFDPQSNDFVNCIGSPEFHRMQGLLGNELRNAMSKSRFGYDQALFNDLEYMDLGKYRMIVFQNPTMLNDHRVKVLKEKVLTSGRTIVWGTVPGNVFNGKYTGKAYEFEPGDYTAVLPEDPSELTGEKLRELAIKAGAHVFEPGCAQWDSREFLLLNCGSESIPGEREVTLRRNAERVTELYSGKVIPVVGRKFKDVFAASETKLYLIEGEN